MALERDGFENDNCSVNSECTLEEVFAQKIFYGPDENADDVCFIWDPDADPDQASDAEGERWSVKSGETRLLPFITKRLMVKPEMQ